MKLKPSSIWSCTAALLLAAPRMGAAQQTYHGDGAVNGGAGAWSISATSDQCLACHSPSGGAKDESAYLMTGHKNMMRKVTPGKPWTFSDGSPLRTSDTPAAGSLYESGSTFDWATGKITVGNGPLIPYPPDLLVGTQQDIFYIFGGWVDPSQLDTIWRGGFTGEQFASGNYDCARCHTAGYRFDDSGTEPTFGGAKISAADFSRVPTDYDPATGPTASWMQDGVTCERCHVADNGTVNHTAAGAVSGGFPTKPTGTAATALCLECHRTEIVDPVANTISFDTGQYVQDGGACSDGVTADYATCIAIPGNTWNYAPFFDHLSGLSFLNSPHARFSGSMTLNAQNSADLSVVLTGQYNSYFQVEFGGCTACHDPHQSFTATGAVPLKKQCTDCHSQYSNLLTKTNHKNTANTPYGVRGDINGACAVCHLTQGLHFFRNSVDPSYTLYPTAAAFYAGQTTANTAQDGSLTPTGALFPAVWNDVDLTCGQCHVGNSASIGLPLTVQGAPVFDKATLAQNAICIHHQPLVHVDFGSNGSVSPAGIYNPLYGNMGSSPTFTFTPAAGYEVKTMNIDGAVYYTQQTSYTFTNLGDCHHIDVAFGAKPTITATAGAGGAISPAGVTQVNTGGSVAYTVTASPGYSIANVIVDGATSVGAGAASPFSYTFSHVQGSSHTIAASFQALPPPPPTTFKVTVSASGSGTITDSADSTVVSGGTGTEVVAKGASITFSFNPATGYKVGAVTVNGVGLAAPLPTSYTFTNVRFSNSLSVSFYPGP